MLGQVKVQGKGTQEKEKQDYILVCQNWRSQIFPITQSDYDDYEEEESFYVVPLESIHKSLDRTKIKRKEREEQKQKQLESTRRSVNPSAPPSVSLGSWEQKEGLLSVLEYGRRSERK